MGSSTRLLINRFLIKKTCNASFRLFSKFSIHQFSMLSKQGRAQGVGPLVKFFAHFGGAQPP